MQAVWQCCAIYALYGRELTSAQQLQHPARARASSWRAQQGALFRNISECAFPMAFLHVAMSLRALN